MKRQASQGFGYRAAVRFLAPHMRRFRRNFVLFYIGWFMHMLLQLAMPVLLGIMVDQVVYYANLAAFLQVGLVFLLLSLFIAGLYFLIYMQHQHLMCMYVFSLQRDVFRHLQRCRADVLAGAKTGDILTMMLDDARECMHFVIRNIIHFINANLQMVAMAVFMLFISPLLALFVLVAAPLSVVVGRVCGARVRAAAAARREQQGNLASYLEEVLTAVADLRLLGAGARVRHRLAGLQRGLLGAKARGDAWVQTADACTKGVTLLVQLGLFALCGLLAARGAITVGTFTVVMAYYIQLTKAVENATRDWVESQGRVASAHRLHSFLQQPVETERADKPPLRVTRGEIRFENLHFAYPGGRQALRGVSLTVHSGERMCLCGASGGGKTTLCQLAWGLYQPDEGRIYIDGQDITRHSLASLRAAVGVVAQDMLVFAGTVRENLLLAKPRASDEALWAALEAACLAGEVRALPGGLDAPLGAEGVGLSGGQRQRLCIARIYLKDPPILLFDEATSALDEATEAAVHAAWGQVLQGRTCLVVAHRYSAMALCGRVAFLQAGRVAACGPPERLSRENQDFARLFGLEGASHAE